MRTGLILEKLGSTSKFSDNGERIEVTLLKMQRCNVMSHRTVEANGYEAVVLAYGAVKANRVTKPMKMVFENANLEARKIVKEFRVSGDNMLEIGSELNVDHFVVGQYVDVTGISIGKGFAGVMKRHNFGGLEATHGVSVSHRSHGSTGGRQDPGRVFKGKKMAGHLGAKRVTVQNIQVVDVQHDNRVLVLKGSVPGAKGSVIFLKDAIKK